jgi:predicted SpoU family rRNA methylase
VGQYFSDYAPPEGQPMERMVHVLSHKPIPLRDALIACRLDVAAGTLRSAVKTFRFGDNGQRAFLTHPVRKIEIVKRWGGAFDVSVEAMALKH